jgi:hypothetical protein
MIFADVRLAGAMDGIDLAWEVKTRFVDPAPCIDTRVSSLTLALRPLSRMPRPSERLEA